MATDTPTHDTATISQDDEIRINTAVYQPHFADSEYVRLGVHPTFDLIFIRPVAVGDFTEAPSDVAYKLDHTPYTCEISCRAFLQRHNYHHDTTTQYVATWWPTQDVLCVDLTDTAE